MTLDPTHDDGILTPDELQLEDDTVAELSGNRYLVRSDGETAAADPAAGATTITPDSSATHLESDHAQSAPATELADAADPHGVEITLKTDVELAHYHATSHDVREVFVDLLT
ncbi:DUF7500 family protein [Natronorubrum texcoconense]|uniref:Uncharacterized protein n=1 Tax=Natronorubrum texcoconense TaxID=1095776 RepID=A0A1G9F9C6_9EURY|nr:hypothetical protein [Natronorubrum texcoconense]SDK84928.1 hypothetical protein SAMN04515672_4136 [Natronorubrum texcoconense]